MTTAALHRGFDSRPVVPRITPARSSVGWSIRRLWNALSKARRHRAEVEIAAYVQLRGGRMTDALERDIERHFMRGRF
jgi:hypothetical protein